MDTLGQILWIAMFLTPLITIPIVWRYKEMSKVSRILIGLFLAGVISVSLYNISLDILFREGMGP